MNSPVGFSDPTGHMQYEDSYSSHGVKCKQGDTSCNWIGSDNNKDKEKGSGNETDVCVKCHVIKTSTPTPTSTPTLSATFTPCPSGPSNCNATQTQAAAATATPTPSGCIRNLSGDCVYPTFTPFAQEAVNGAQTAVAVGVNTCGGPANVPCGEIIQRAGQAAPLFRVPVININPDIINFITTLLGGL